MPLENLHKREIYNNDPIAEVICEFHFEQNPENDTSIVPGQLYEVLKSQFPKHQKAMRSNIGITASQSYISHQLETRPITQFRNEQENAIIQSGDDTLIVNHLKKYPGWDKFSKIVENAYKCYIKKAQPRRITQITLRYINLIHIPSPTIKFVDYFNFLPFLGEGLPQEMSSFFIGIKVLKENGRDLLGFHLTNTDSENDEETAAILDINYTLIDTANIEINSVFSWLGQAHDYIEDTFQGIIKDELRTIFRGGLKNGKPAR